ncbi:hypothetical protein JVT61DRAFT_6412 [Boletus reticuloceps]|uniref:Uncharacterized protein n=1 Tax=Boletus reticuloceps TaxID=495285 RepID=A0A8I2YK85_9AGAM|nr:hypothetical protein JVT61DRAFT_6412 [Boletus reticuloceps]
MQNYLCQDDASPCRHLQGQDRDRVQLDEYGGQKMDAQVVEASLRTTGINQQDLESDPALHRRSRGELD